MIKSFYQLKGAWMHAGHGEGCVSACASRSRPIPCEALRRAVTLCPVPTRLASPCRWRRCPWRRCCGMCRTSAGTRHTGGGWEGGGGRWQEEGGKWELGGGRVLCSMPKMSAVVVPAWARCVPMERPVTLALGAHCTCTCTALPATGRTLAPATAANAYTHADTHTHTHTHTHITTHTHTHTRIPFHTRACGCSLDLRAEDGTPRPGQLRVHISVHEQAAYAQVRAGPWGRWALGSAQAACMGGLRLNLCTSSDRERTERQHAAVDVLNDHRERKHAAITCVCVCVCVTAAGHGAG